MTPTIVSRGTLPNDLALAKVKNYLRVYDSEHDSTIQLLIEAAIEFIQTYTRQTFRPTTYEQVFTTSPVVLPRFPVINLVSVSIFDGANYVSGDLADWQEVETLPPQLRFLGSDAVFLPVKVRWVAGLVDWPKDLTLLVYQMVEENFDRRGTTPETAQAAKFSRSHQLALEQYCTHHDAVR